MMIEFWWPSPSYNNDTVIKKIGKVQSFCDKVRFATKERNLIRAYPHSRFLKNFPYHIFRKVRGNYPLKYPLAPPPLYET